ncbi:MAG: recombinase family protein [Longibaculum sp.]
MLENNNLNSVTNKKEVNNECIEAIAYCRVDKNKYHSAIGVECQKLKIKSYAKANNIKIVGWYVDAGYNGNNANRPALQEMLKDINQGKYKNVKFLLVSKIERIARNIDMLKEYYTLFTNNEINLKATNFELDNNVEKNLLLTFFNIYENKKGAKL